MTTTPFDYRLAGPNNAWALDQGLAEAPWWRPPIDDDRLTRLMQRSNGRAARDTVLWLGLTVAFGVLVAVTWFSVWTIPLLAVYGALYGGAADSRWHECGHGTAFKTGWLNDVVYYLASFMLWREPTLWRWTHHRHHTDTIVMGRDAEIAFQRPPKAWRLPWVYLHLQGALQMFWRMARHATGRIDAEAQAVVPETERRRMIAEDRVFVAVVAAAAAACVVSGSLLPLVLVGLPTIYGGWLVVFFGITQHAGLQENVLDHRRNTRTVYMNPVFRFLYSNMNYHIEHHLFPGVPYHALPALHQEIKPYLPEPNPSILSAYRELLGALKHQQRDPAWEIPNRQIPEVPSATLTPIDTGPIIDHEVGDADSGQRGLSKADLGRLDALAVGQARRVEVGGKSLALYRIAEDEVAVSDGICTHGHALLAEGLVIDCTIECPRHNGRFDLRTGEPTRKPVTKPIAIYPVTVVDDRIVLDLSDLDHPAD